MARARFLLLAATLALIPAATSAPLSAPATAQTITRPSVVIILTDDQRADELWMMDAVRRRLMRQGVVFDRSFVADPLCCPSRVSLLTGLYPHTSGVWTNRGEEGGWVSFDAAGLESRTIAIGLHRAGYRTAYLGKYLNNYQYAGGEVPRGWDRWFVFDQQNGAYYDYDIASAQGGSSEALTFGSEAADYSTDVLAAEATSFVASTAPDTPLFLIVAPYAPHAPGTPAPRHDGVFAGLAIERAPSYQEERVGDKPRHIRRLAKWPSFPADRIRSRAEALLAVDDLVDQVAGALRDTGRLQETLFVFTSDNGYLLGEHRWSYKIVPYEEAIRVPLVIRYDPLTQGSRTDVLVVNVDLTATIAELADVPLDSDGKSLLPTLTSGASVRSAVVLESQEFTPNRLSTVPSYCGIRTRSRTYVRYATGEEELYDLRADPFQLVSVDEGSPRTLRRLRQKAKARCQPVPPLFDWQP